MKFTLPVPQGTSSKLLLQRAGYHEFVDPNTGSTSYIRRLGASFYPRFHMYIEEERGSVELNVHIDQKHVSYEGTAAHSGEYSGPLIDAECARVTSSFALKALMRLTANGGAPAPSVSSGNARVGSLRDKIGME